MRQLQTIYQLELELKEYLALSLKHWRLECDGFSQVLAHDMIERGYKPIIECGHVTYNGTTIYHHWVNLNGKIFDFRLQMWFGITAPCGIVNDPLLNYEKFGKVKLQSRQVIDFMCSDVSDILRLLKIPGIKFNSKKVKLKNGSLEKHT